jgi:hypothetical protein
MGNLFAPNLSTYDNVIYVDMENIFTNDFLTPGQKIYYFLVYWEKNNETKLMNFLQTIDKYENIEANAETFMFKTREKLYIKVNNDMLIFDRKQIGRNKLYKSKYSILGYAIRYVSENKLSPNLFAVLVNKNTTTMTYNDVYNFLVKIYDVKYKYQYVTYHQHETYSGKRKRSNRTGSRTERRVHVEYKIPSNIEQLRDSFSSKLDTQTQQEKTEITNAISSILSNINTKINELELSKLIALCELIKNNELINQFAG